MEISKIRDLTLIKLENKQTMVVACDSCGGVGMKPKDILKVPEVQVGRFTARVALLEVLCSGAEIVTVTDAVCNEMEPTGREIISGIREELKAAGLRDVVLTGSTEENFHTFATGLGVTVIGIAANNKLKVNNIKEQALIVSIGIPKVGAEINLDGDNEIVDYVSVYKLLEQKCVYEIVPVGSKGMAYEVEQLALNNRGAFQMEGSVKVDLKKSGGPATCIIAAIDVSSFDYISLLVPNVNIIGRLTLDIL